MRILAGLIASVVGALAACVTPSAPPGADASASAVDPPDDGIKVVGLVWEASPSSGLSGLAVEISRDPLTLRVEAIRGGETPNEVFLTDPDAPEHEVDARVIGQSGQPFAELVGGHGFIDSRWGDDSGATWVEPPSAFRASEWDLLRDALPQIASSVLPDAQRELREAMVALIEGSLLPTEETDPGTGGEGIELPEGAVPSVQTSNHHHFEIWRKSVAVIANHTATRTLSHYANGTLSQTRITCNHGTCATVSPMAQRCTRLFLNRSLSLPAMSSCGTTSANPSNAYLSCCTTPYSLSGNANTHVCNDDTLLQREMAVTQSCPANFSACSAAGLNTTAPNCN